MADYICRNCGHMQCSSGTNGGCAYTFWFILLIITIFIGLFAPLAFIVVAFEVLFLILTSRNPDSNFCFKCKARGCVVPFNTPAGQQIYRTFYPEEYEEKKQKEEQERKRKEEDAQAREDAGLSYLDKFHIEEPSIGKFLLFLLISAAVVFVIFLSLSGVRTLIGAAPQKEVATTPHAQQQAKPENKPQKLTQTECETLYKTSGMSGFFMNYTTNKTIPGKEAVINDYYNKCSDYAMRDKYSYLAAYYLGLGVELDQQYKYEQAIPYYKKALEANLKSTDKLNLVFNYDLLAKCYFNTWQMEEAKKYALLVVKEKQKLGNVRIGLVDYERLGDICYNLKQYDEAEEYYTKALNEVEWLESLPDNQTYEHIQELEQKREKFISILNGTFSQ